MIARFAATSRLCKFLTVGVLAVVATVASSIPCSGAPIQFGANFYELVFVDDPFTGANNSWATASAAASARTYGGVHGHLATVTSAAENDFLFGLSPTFGTFEGAWLGGNFTNWLVGPEAGDPLSYTNWGGIEPNDSGLMYMNLGVHFQIGPGQWADDSFVQGVPDAEFDPVIGYFVEYESPSAAVPEPTSLLLVATGTTGLIARSRRRQRPR